MSVWSYLTGVVHIEGSRTEDELLAIYQKFSHNFIGSEGGLHISFTRTTKKNWSSSSEDDYCVEPFTRISNMVFSGHLRDFDEYKVENAIEALKDFLYELRHFNCIQQASFVVDCSASDTYYHVAFTKGRVRTKKVKIK